MATVKQLQQTLQYTYGLVPIVAGLDKFTNILVTWENYLGANVRDMLPLDAALFMKIVGVIEIIAGLIVLIRPLIGAYIVMIWLLCIAVSLVISGFYDVAVRDTVMAIGAYTLAQLTLLTKGRGVA
ncbi:MAG TPA: hypothetical protein VHM26_03955 [Chitinophagaceae bacterium]|jgi:hypothetical protein|nr:hypothetical protein [Chitinophagaceae bacterium]